MYCDTNQLKELPFCGPHPKPHGARGLSKIYHLRFDPKLGHSICEILRIPCDYVACTSMIDQLWIYGMSLKNKQTTNQSQIVLTGQFWSHLTIGI